MILELDYTTIKLHRFKHVKRPIIEEKNIFKIILCFYIWSQFVTLAIVINVTITHLSGFVVPLIYPRKRKWKVFRSLHARHFQIWFKEPLYFPKVVEGLFQNIFLYFNKFIWCSYRLYGVAWLLAILINNF